MDVNIASNLKRLRKQREITQEDLANFIGVSFQAVSKWERGDGYPDITMLPTLANFFDVTLDELVGMAEIKSQVQLEKIQKQISKLVFKGAKVSESIALLRNALITFPNNYWLLSELALFLGVWDDLTEEEKRKNNEEAVKISERILEFCTDTEIRNRVQANICGNLYWAGEEDKSIELAKKLPLMRETSAYILPMLLRGKERIKQLQINIHALTGELANNIRLLVNQSENDGYYTDETRFKLYQKAIDIYKTVYEEEDFDFGHEHLRDIYIGIARIYIKQDNKDEAIKSLEKAAKHAIAYLKLRQQEPYEQKSLLVNRLTGGETGKGGTNCAQLTKDWIEGVWFKSIRDHETIKNILAELDEYVAYAN